MTKHQDRTPEQVAEIRRLAAIARTETELRIAGTTISYVVAVDPAGARSTVAEYGSYAEAAGRLSRAWDTIKTTGGAVALYGPGGALIQQEVTQ